METVLAIMLIPTTTMMAFKITLMLFHLTRQSLQIPIWMALATMQILMTMGTVLKMPLMRSRWTPLRQSTLMLMALVITRIPMMMVTVLMTDRIHFH